MNIKNHERKKGIQMQTDFHFTKNKLKKMQKIEKVNIVPELFQNLPIQFFEMLKF